MSNYPPYGSGAPQPPHGSGGPPPPYYGQPHYPPGYTYAPMVVPMPVYPYPNPYRQSAPEPQPSNTYVTNYIYPKPETEDASMIDWIPTTSSSANNFQNRAVVAGHEGWDGSPLWVIRARHGGDCVPGKFAAKHNAAYIAYNGKEIKVHDFELMVGPSSALRWLPSSNGIVPSGAIAAGNTVSGEPLYIARARHMMSLTPGKLHPSHGCCYISFGGNEISYRSFEVLCKI